MSTHTHTELHATYPRTPDRYSPEVRAAVEEAMLDTIKAMQGTTDTGAAERARLNFQALCGVVLN